MKNKVKMPSSLTKLIITKFILGGIFFVGFILISIFFKDRLFLALAPAAFAMFTLGDAVVTLYNCRTDNYVVIEGKCIEIETTRIKKRIKSVCLDTRKGRVRVIVHYKLNTVESGDYITVYMPMSAAVYEHNREFVVNEYYVVDIVRKT